MDIRYLNKKINEGLNKGWSNNKLNITETLNSDHKECLKAVLLDKNEKAKLEFNNLEIPKSIDSFLTNLNHQAMTKYEMNNDADARYFYKETLPVLKKDLEDELLSTSDWVFEKDLIREEEYAKNLSAEQKKEIENYIYDGKIKEVGKSLKEKINNHFLKRESFTDKLAKLESTDYLTLADIVKADKNANIVIAMEGSDIDITKLVKENKFNKEEMFLKEVKLCKNADAIDETNLATRYCTYADLRKSKKGEIEIDSIYLDESAYSKLNIKNKMRYIEKEKELDVEME